MKRVMLLALLLMSTTAYPASVDISCVMRADRPEYITTGPYFGGSSIYPDAAFWYSAFGEPGNDALALESPIVVLKAVGVDITDSIIIIGVTLELVITQPFWLGSTPIECYERIEL